MFGIGEAVKHMQDGLAVERSGWNGRGMFVFIERSEGALDQHQVGSTLVEAECADLVWMKTADDKFVPWLCSQADLLATDWSIAHVSI